MIDKQPQFDIKMPKNAAVHFGNFYGLWNDVEKASHNNHWNNHFINEETEIKRPHRLQFTRQMVNE